MKTGAESEALAESSGNVDKTENGRDVKVRELNKSDGRRDGNRKEAERPRFRGEIQYEQLEQKRAAAENAPGSTIRILRTGGRSTAAEEKAMGKSRQSMGGESPIIGGQIRTNPDRRQARPQVQGGNQPGGQTRVQAQGGNQPGRQIRVQTQSSNQPGRQTRSQVRRDGERPRFHPTGEEKEYSQSRVRAASERRKRRQRQKLTAAAGLLCLVLLSGGAIFGIFRWRQSSERRELAEQAVAMMDAGSYEEAISVFDQALEGAGKRIGGFEKDVLLNRAEAEYRHGDFEAAANTYELILSQDENNEAALKGQVLCMIEKGQFEEALKQGLLESQVYNRMAVKAIEEGRFQEAMDFISQGRGVSDTSAARALDFNEAVIWEKQGDFKKALELFEAYLAKYGSDEEAEREVAFLKSRLR